WGIWGRWGDWMWLANNTVVSNLNGNLLSEVTNLRDGHDDPDVTRPPHAEFSGPSRAMVGGPVHFDARQSSDPSGRTLPFRWMGGELTSEGPAVDHTFTSPGFYRLGLSVDNGALADLAWQDLIVSDTVRRELGTENLAAQWGFELEGNSDGRGRI